LGAGEDNRDLDAGIYRPTASIGNFVWDDLNQDGIQDANEPGVSGVLVALSDANGIQYLDTTDANGFYGFTDLPPGDYSLFFYNLPADYVISPQDTGADDVDSDVDPQTGRAVATTLDPGENDPDWDLGIYVPNASLGDRVWYDDNENGIQDGSEIGVPGVRVVLYDANGDSIDVRTTDAQGNYLFEDLEPGDYRVGFFDLPVNYVLSPQDAATFDSDDSDADPATGVTATVNLAPGEDNRDVDAGIYLPKASLGDYVWNDTDNDGVQGPNEDGVAGVTVILYNDLGQPIDSQLTDINGGYLFEDLNPGTYTVGFTNLPPDYIFSPQDNTNDSSDSDADANTGLTAPVTLAPGEDNRDVDAGIYLPVASLGDRVWYDANEDGIQDPTEGGVAGVKVILYDDMGMKIDSTTTDNQGNYLFDNLQPGDYQVGFELPTDFVVSPQDQGDDNTDSDVDPQTGLSPIVSLSAGENDLSVDAGIYEPKASLGDYVWEDDDKDGVQDPSETGVAGVTVVLYNAAGDSLDVRTTDASGAYLFEDLVPGDYYVVFSDLPKGYGFTTANSTADNLDSDAGQNGQTPIVSLSAGEDYRDLDAGIIAPSAALGDYVWELSLIHISSPRDRTRSRMPSSA